MKVGLSPGRRPRSRWRNCFAESAFEGLAQFEDLHPGFPPREARLEFLTARGGTSPGQAIFQAADPDLSHPVTFRQEGEIRHTAVARAWARFQARMAASAVFSQGNATHRHCAYHTTSKLGIKESG